MTIKLKSDFEKIKHLSKIQMTNIYVIYYTQVKELVFIPNNYFYKNDVKIMY